MKSIYSTKRAKAIFLVKKQRIQSQDVEMMERVGCVCGRKRRKRRGRRESRFLKYPKAVANSRRAVSVSSVNQMKCRAVGSRLVNKGGGPEVDAYD